MPFKCRLNDIKSVIIGECEEWSKEIFVRMWCAPKLIFADPLQRHCSAIAVNIYFAYLYFAVISLHLLKHQN